MYGNFFEFDYEILFVTLAGYTGEDGFEISMPNNKVENFIKFLVDI